MEKGKWVLLYSCLDFGWWYISHVTSDDYSGVGWIHGFGVDEANCLHHTSVDHLVHTLHRSIINSLRDKYPWHIYHSTLYIINAPVIKQMTCSSVCIYEFLKNWREALPAISIREKGADLVACGRYDKTCTGASVLLSRTNPLDITRLAILRVYESTTVNQSAYKGFSGFWSLKGVITWSTRKSTWNVCIVKLHNRCPWSQTTYRLVCCSWKCLLIGFVHTKSIYCLTEVNRVTCSWAAGRTFWLMRHSHSQSKLTTSWPCLAARRATGSLQWFATTWV